MADVSIAPARADDLTAVRALLREYASSLQVGLDFQGFDGELAGLPGSYAPPGGALFVARDAAGVVVGCVGVRRSTGSPAR